MGRYEKSDGLLLRPERRSQERGGGGVVGQRHRKDHDGEDDSGEIEPDEGWCTMDAKVSQTQHVNTDFDGTVSKRLDSEIETWRSMSSTPR